MSHSAQEIRAFYSGFEQALRLHAYRKGRCKVVGNPDPNKHTLLADALADMAKAKKLALENASKPEKPKYAIVSGDLTPSGTVMAEVRSFTDPAKTYRVAYHAKTTRVHCTCRSFENLNYGKCSYPVAGEVDRICKHIRDFLPSLIESAKEQSA